MFWVSPIPILVKAERRSSVLRLSPSLHYFVHFVIKGKEKKQIIFFYIRVFFTSFSVYNIGPDVKANKTEYICFYREGIISTAQRKLVDTFTYLGKSVSSSESEYQYSPTAIDRLSITWKSDLFDKIKRDFVKAAVVSILPYGCTRWTMKKHRGKARQPRQTYTTSYGEQILEATPHETTIVRQLTSHL